MSKEKEEAYDRLYTESYKEKGIEEEKPADSGVTEMAEKPSETAEVKESEKEKGAEESLQETEPKEEIKTVPLAALHEEREKRRKIKSELEARITREREEKQEILDTLYEYTKTDKEDLLPEEKISVLEEKITSLDERTKKADREREESSRRMEYERASKNVDAVDTELSGEGFPGFKKFKDLVLKEISLLPEEEGLKANADPADWKKIYKETVFPELISAFGNIDKIKFKEQSEAKNELKKKVQMLGERKADTTKPKTETWSYDDYMQSRRRLKA